MSRAAAISILPAVIAVLNTGHCHPHVMAAVREQMERFTHTCFQVLLYEPYIQLAERLNALAPIAGAKKSALFTTGAEATENAIKIARAATGRSGVIAFTGGFHGRTMMAMTMTGKVSPYKVGFGAGVPEIFHVPFSVPQSGVTVEDSLRHLGFLFKADIDPARVAAIIIEPVQGEGGFHQAPAELMRELRRVCDAHGIVLIADEVQTGFGRTGKLFAMEHYDVEPRPDLRGQEPGRGISAVRRHRQGVDHGRGRSGRSRRHLCGQPLVLRGGACRARCVRAGKPRRPLQCHRRAFEDPSSRPRAEERSAPDCRDPGTRRDDRLRRGEGACSDEPDAEATKRITRRAYENASSCCRAARRFRPFASWCR